MIRLCRRIALTAIVAIAITGCSPRPYQTDVPSTSTAVTQTPATAAGLSSPTPAPSHSHHEPTIANCADRQTQVTPAVSEILVYFTCEAHPPPSQPQPVTRPAPNTVDTQTRLHIALESLLRGPTPQEQAAGLNSWFSVQTTGMLNSVTIDPEGLAIVDFKNFSHIIPNASTSAGSQMLLSQLNSTVFQFTQVKAVVYRFDGDCEAFWNWLQKRCQHVFKSSNEESQRDGEIRKSCTAPVHPSSSTSLCLTINPSVLCSSTASTQFQEIVGPCS